jgi:hypothetical protein
MRATVDFVATEYEADESAMTALPAFELSAPEGVPGDDVASLLAAALEAESSFAPPHAARTASRAQRTARLRVMECMLMFPVR